MAKMGDSKGRRFRFPYTGALSRLFSGQVEESLKLRLMGLATFWLVALAVAWVGGSPWTWLGGGIAATCGHAFSWHRRHRSPGMWPLFMALTIIALAMVMRTEVLAAFDGNWLPLAHFLLLVQAVSSFDIRTRGGLYAGLGLSAIVLFFASQQAFELSFGIFLLGYAALLMAFLATATWQDEAGKARVSPARAGIPFGFWSGTAAAVLLLAIAAFLVLPRGESNAVGYQQVAALPISGDPVGSQAGPETTPRTLRDTPGGTPDPGGSSIGGPSGGDSVSEGDSGGTAPEGPEGPEVSSGEGVVLLNDAISTPSAAVGDDSLVMHVRSPVASYWRGQVFDKFDGRVWRPENSTAASGDALPVPGNPLRYTQTFYMHRPLADGTFMGYRGVEVLSAEDTRYRQSLGKGFSYKVVSVQPDLVPETLRQDRPGRADRRYYSIPASLDWLRGLSGRITGEAETGLDKAANMVTYLRRDGRYDTSAPNQLRSSAPLDAFLLDGEPGTSLDYATAAVMLARAAGLPARLATGYLPGDRDLLSGAYAVRTEHAQAWAEVLFEEHGWVPFDGTHHPSLYAGGRTAGAKIAGLKYLFESSVGDDLVRAAVLAPSKLSAGVKDALNSPVIVTALTAVAAGLFALGLGWLGMRVIRRGRKKINGRWAYTRLPGDGRGEMLRLYSRVEKLLRKKGVEARKRGQTLQEYADLVRGKVGDGGSHLDWFTGAAWDAAYNSNAFPVHLLPEARARLTALRTALG